MKKIIIFYASYGGGHLSAARSIKQYIDSNYSDMNVELIDCVKYISNALDKVTTTAYKEMAKKAPWAWGRVYAKSQKGALAHISSSSNKLMAIKLLKLLREKNPDLIISTHPFGSQMVSYLKRKEKFDCSLATVMTDYAPHEQWLIGKEYIDYFFVAHKGMKEALEAHNIPAERIHVTGIPLSGKFLKHYDRSGIFSDFHLNPEKKVILFFGGGEFGLGKTRTLEILSALISASDAQIVAIAGKNEKMKKHFDEISVTCSRPEDILVLPFTDKVPELMSISYLVVTKPGGLTTTESLASGLPLILINPIPGQEEENAAFLEKEGVAFWLRKTDSPYEALSEFFQNPEKIKKMRLNAKLHAKRNSTKDICSILLDQPS